MIFKYSALAVVFFSWQMSAVQAADITATSTDATPVASSAVARGIVPVAASDTTARHPVTTAETVPAVASVAKTEATSVAPVATAADNIPAPEPTVTTGSGVITASDMSTQGKTASAQPAASAASATGNTAPSVVTAPVQDSVAATPYPTPVTSTPVSSPALASATVLAFTPEQEARIGEVAKTYLLAHPEILLEVSQKLQVREQAQQLHALTTDVLAHQDALLNDKATPSFGPADAKVALVEFFDYQCSACAQQAPVLEALMKANPQVRYVFKEWPIFGARWPASLVAAETGLQVWQQKGAEAYLAYHNAVYATGHNEGKLTLQDISHASVKAGKLKGKKAETLEILVQIDTLAQTLRLRGTPAMIVMPVSGATTDNITVIPGGVNLGALQAAIDKAVGR